MFRCTRRPAFSMIELLVVMAILALLLAVLMPVVQSAREQARRSACAGNLRTIAQGWHLYVEDRGGFPLESIGSPLRISFLNGGKREILSQQFAANPPRPRPLNPFVGADEELPETTRAFWCPSDAGLVEFPEPEADGATWYDYAGTSYPLSSFLLSGGHPGTNSFRLGAPLRFDDFNVPPALVMVTGDLAFLWGANPSPPLHAYWHESTGRRMNVGFADASVRFVQMLSGQPEAGQYRYRWSRW
jgi:prepilin-type N-terminal cleavage/methylation domain-containing protein